MQRCLAVASVLAVGAFTVVHAGAAPGTRRAPVIYDTDDRQEYYQVSDEKAQQVARESIVAMISPSRLDLTVPTSVRVVGESVPEQPSLCEPLRFWDQPVAVSCSGTLVDDDLVLTAGHCFLDEEDCRRHRFVFGFYYRAAGELAAISTEDVYACRSLVAHAWVAYGADYALVELDRPVDAARAPAPVAQARDGVVPGASVVALGFGEGLPMKLDLGGHVLDASWPEREYFTATPDAFAGASGMGIFDSDLNVLGLLARGMPDYVEEGDCVAANRIDVDCSDCYVGGENITYVDLAVSDLCSGGWPSERLCGIAPSCGDGICSGTETDEVCAEDCPAPRCGDGVCDVGEAPGGCPADCGAPEDRPVPAAWTCPAEWYARRDGCDCECGAYDLDCIDAAAELFQCPERQVCNADGHCVPSAAPSAWVCPVTYYGTGDGCDCDCGAQDPDCDSPWVPVFNCPSGDACVAGECESGPIATGDGGSSGGGRGGCGCGVPGSAPRSALAAWLGLALLVLRRRPRNDV